MAQKLTDPGSDKKKSTYVDNFNGLFDVWHANTHDTFAAKREFFSLLSKKRVGTVVSDIWTKAWLLRKSELNRSGKLEKGGKKSQ